MMEVAGTIMYITRYLTSFENDVQSDSDSGSNSTHTSFHSDLCLSDDGDDIRVHDKEMLIFTKDWKCNVPNKNCRHETDFGAIPFTEGQFRYAFLGHWCDYHGKLSQYPGKRHGQVCVVKKWKKEHVYNATFWDRDLRVAEIANKLAQKWNKKFKGMGLRRIRILQPIKHVCVHQYKRHGHVAIDHEEKNNTCPKDCVALDERVIVEDYLSGNFIKWNSNSGWVHHESSMIQSFCHWTYHYSNSKILLCDAQGILHMLYV